MYVTCKNQGLSCTGFYEILDSWLTCVYNSASKNCSDLRSSMTQLCNWLYQIVQSIDCNQKINILFILWLLTMNVRISPHGYQY